MNLIYFQREQAAAMESDNEDNKASVPLPASSITETDLKVGITFSKSYGM